MKIALFKLCVSNRAKRCWLQALVKELAHCLSHATYEEQTWCNGAHNFELELLFFIFFLWACTCTNMQLTSCGLWMLHNIWNHPTSSAVVPKPFSFRDFLGAFLSLSNLMTPDPRIRGSFFSCFKELFKEICQFFNNHTYWIGFFFWQICCFLLPDSWTLLYSHLGWFNCTFQMQDKAARQRWRLCERT